MNLVMRASQTFANLETSSHLYDHTLGLREIYWLRSLEDS